MTGEAAGEAAGEAVRCACGRPLHYRDLRLKRMVCELVRDRGPDIIVPVGGVFWLMQRHYVALHGVGVADWSALGFVEVGGAVAGRGLQ